MLTFISKKSYILINQKLLMVIKNDLFPPELKAIFDSLDYEESGGLVITSLTFIDEDLKILFTLSFGNGESPNQFWELLVIGIKKEKFISEWVSYPEIYTDHFLLYEFLDYYTELYYNGKADNSEKLFIDLYKLNIGLYSNQFEFGFGINAPNGMTKLCFDSHGLFARGPKRILEHYQKLLSKHNIQSNFIYNIEPKEKGLKLLIWGESYFIGKEFYFKQL